MLAAGIVQADSEARQLYHSVFGIHAGIQMQDQAARFKYVLVVEGNGERRSSSWTHSGCLDCMSRLPVPALASPPAPWHPLPLT